MTIFLSTLLWCLTLLLQAAQEPKMLRTARLNEIHIPQMVRWLRYPMPVLALVLCLCDRASIAILLWAGTFSLAALLVALAWATLARQRDLFHQAHRMDARTVRKPD